MYVETCHTWSGFSNAVCTINTNSSKVKCFSVAAFSKAARYPGFESILIYLGSSKAFAKSVNSRETGGNGVVRVIFLSATFTPMAVLLSLVTMGSVGAAKVNCKY